VVVLHDPDQFLSLLTNLLLNAFDATAPGGRVTVVARWSDPANAVVSVSDTGPGISSEMAEKLFMPFSTGKPSGTGLGLVVARRVAVEHGGTLIATNRAEGGACFTVTIPATEFPDAEAARH
jgi:signal transduction histidine kinase